MNRSSELTMHVRRHKEAYTNRYGDRLAADFLLYQQAWRLIGGLRASIMFFSLRIFGSTYWGGEK